MRILFKIGGVAASVLIAAALVMALTRSVRSAPSTPAPALDLPAPSMSDFKKPDTATLKAKLSPDQYAVTQQCGTEPPFRNAYWNNHAPGLYVDVVSGEPLFSSLDKFDSGTGWPSFTRPIESTNVFEKADHEFGMVRTEVRSKKADSHLGHLFDDGPAPTRTRYCINSAALRFIPVDKMAEEGYGAYLAPFIKAGLVAASATGADTRASTNAVTAAPKTETALLAGGCFWGMEEIVRKLPGVIETTVGYTGGTVKNPSYEAVCTGRTGHAEGLRVVFDPSKLSYEQLLGYFFRMHDPTTLNRQHNDIGTQYRSAIFYLSDEQRQTAEKVKAQFNQSGRFKKPIVTEITQATEFYPGEDYHQKYLVKHPNGYNCHILQD